MKLRKITAISRRDLLEKVERQLQNIGATGISVTEVKGYGQYANTYSKDWLTRHARIEIFAGQEYAERIVEAIIAAAHTGVAGDGIVAILPVEKVYRVRSKTLARVEEL